MHQALGTQADVAPDLRRHSPLNPSSIRQPGPLSSLFKFRELRLRVRYTMEYYSAIKMNTFESVLMRWM